MALLVDIVGDEAAALPWVRLQHLLTLNRGRFHSLGLVLQYFDFQVMYMLSGLIALSGAFYWYYLTAGGRCNGPFLHALFPYLLGNYFKKRKEEIQLFVVGGIAPILIFSLLIQYLYPTFFLITHRGITTRFFSDFHRHNSIIFATRNRVKKIVQKYIDFEPVFSRRNIVYAFTGIIVHLVLIIQQQGESRYFTRLMWQDIPQNCSFILIFISQ